MNLCERRGCIKGVKAQSPYLYDGERIWECPLTFYNEEIGQALVLYSGYQKGYLPDQGSFLDQTSRFIDYMDIIGDSVREQERQEMDKMNNKRGKK